MWCKTYAGGGLFSRRAITAVDDVSFRLEAGRPEIFTIIGESGSGKTTLARMILNMVPPSAGTIRFQGTDLATIRGRRARLAFMHQVQPIFQNPFEAFNPLKRVDRYLFATARRMAGLSADADDRRGRRPRAAEGRPVAGRGTRPLPARTVGRPAAARGDRAGADLHAGADRRRRAGVDGRRLAAHVDRQPAARPARRAAASSIIYITHDLATAYYISDRILIMRKGSVVESGDARDRARQSAASLLAPAEEIGAVARRSGGRRRAAAAGT